MDAVSPIAIDPGSLSTGFSPDQIDAVKKRAKEFEAIMLSEMLKPMLNSVDGANLTGAGGVGEGAFNDLLNQEYGKVIAERGGIGIADHVARSLLTLQIENTPSEQRGNE